MLSFSSCGEICRLFTTLIKSILKRNLTLTSLAKYWNNHAIRPYVSWYLEIEMNLLSTQPLTTWHFSSPIRSIAGIKICACIPPSRITSITDSLSLNLSLYCSYTARGLHPSYDTLMLSWWDTDGTYRWIYFLYYSSTLHQLVEYWQNAAFLNQVIQVISSPPSRPSLRRLRIDLVWWFPSYSRSYFTSDGPRTPWLNRSLDTYVYPFLFSFFFFFFANCCSII